MKFRNMRKWPSKEERDAIVNATASRAIEGNRHNHAYRAKKYFSLLFLNFGGNEWRKIELKARETLLEKITSQKGAEEARDIKNFFEWFDEKRKSYWKLKLNEHRATTQLEKEKAKIDLLGYWNSFGIEMDVKVAELEQAGFSSVLVEDCFIWGEERWFKP